MISLDNVRMQIHKLKLEYFIETIAQKENIETEDLSLGQFAFVDNDRIQNWESIRIRRIQMEQLPPHMKQALRSHPSHLPDYVCKRHGFKHSTPDPAGQMIQSFKRDVSTKM